MYYRYITAVMMMMMMIIGLNPGPRARTVKPGPRHLRTRPDPGQNRRYNPGYYRIYQLPDVKNIYI